MPYKSSIFSFPILASTLFFFCLTAASLLAQQTTLCQHMKNKSNLSLRQAADQERSDTLDILHIDLQLDMTQTEVSLIAGAATLSIRSKMDGVDWVSLDLEGLTVDSVLVGGITANFDHQSPLLVVDLPELLNEGDEVEVTVYYQGSPIQDESGWGGFYFNSGFAFNLGVGFDANPHNYGRVWFPCFDNFVERSTYSFHVLTDDGKTAYCGGELVNTELVGQDSLLTHWNLAQAIPSYLASVATGDYVHTQQILNGQLTSIPAWLTAPPADTINVLNSFANLSACFETYEERYGPYRWPRVGFVFVPFSSGAMEHACNIAYPLSLAQGNLSFETLMAHELSHHWWGDLVTCKTEGDMWINEGIASYSESLFLEGVYGQEAYLESVRDNFKDVLLYAHLRDGERLPVSGIDHEHTYGDHVYNKGALVTHNLRTVMGADFFDALQLVTDSFAFEAIDSPTLRDLLQTETDADLDAFFNNWIFAPGFPEFRIASIQNTADQWELTIEQHLHYAPDYYQNVPLTLTLRDSEGNIETHGIMVSGPLSVVEITSELDVVHAYLNHNNGILHAVLDEEKVINSAGIKNFGFAEFRMDFESIGDQDSIWVRVENHWAEAAQLAGQTDILVSSDRFWRIRAEESSSIDAELRLRYYGNPSSSNYFDPLFAELMATEGLTEDDLVGVFRPLNSSIWTVLSETDLNIQGDATNFQGYMDLPWMGNGDYAWAYLTGETSVFPRNQSTPDVYPNPASSYVNIAHAQNWNYRLYSSEGSLVDSGRVNGIIQLDHMAPGSYRLELTDGAKRFSFPIQKVD